MDLYLIRHGQSGSEKSLGRSSGPNGINEKTLTAAGITEIERTGEALKTLNIIPDAIVTSPLGHARHSAEIAEIFVIGHEPFLTKMAADIVSSSSSPNIRRRLSTSDSNPSLGYNRGNHRSIVLKKSGLARISVTSLNPKLEGELQWLLTPLLLRGISLIKKSKKEKGKRNQKIFQYPPIASSSDFTATSRTKSTVTAFHH